ncbi:tetrahydromethanopterin C1 transfer protein [Methylobacterium sp. Leaf466]|nr:ATP-grasp domain-containing protein [Methylobacterium sp. Leaf466]KQT77425.1 tetrahydromethanopterin C1 transfer protein [Methylobacterium sp. Leaf466]
MNRSADTILVAAQSGRALAQAARRAGLVPLVVDLFGDADTLALAGRHRLAAGRFGAGRLDGDALLAHLDDLAATGPTPLGIVLGSGFEDAPDLIARIATRHRLLGASADAVAALKDPIRFASLCERLAIPHPAVTRGAVADPKAWLLKRDGGSGGSHIRAATAAAPPPGAYCQARVRGNAHALAFLADGRDIAAVGVTAQWSDPSRIRPFRYGGAVEQARDATPLLPPALVAAVTRAAAALVSATGLTGLASADILVDGGAWWLMEINPRPGATLDVLDRRPEPLLSAHVAAHLGRLLSVGDVPVDAAAARICYATTDYAPVPPLDWPDHVRDRPRAGSPVARGAPLCTVVATGRDASDARAISQARADRLRARLGSQGVHR